MGLQISEITKKYPNGTLANDNISFEIKKGECVALLGVNGSGKTTLIRQILKILRPTSGSIDIDGNENYIDKLAYTPQLPCIYPALTVRENLTIILKYLGKYNEEGKNKINSVLSLTGLEKVQNNNTYMISGGQKKVLMFCISYIADADYLILDEPTSMVDIIARQKIWDIINSIKKEKGILISSHDTLEVMNVADKVVALKCGKQSFYGDIESNNENDFRKELVKYV